MTLRIAKNRFVRLWWWKLVSADGTVIADGFAKKSDARAFAEQHNYEVAI